MRKYQRTVISYYLDVLLFVVIYEYQLQLTHIYLGEGMILSQTGVYVCICMKMKLQITYPG